MTHTYPVYAISSAGGMAQFVHRTADKRFRLGRLHTQMEATCLLVARVERGEITLDTPARAIVVVVPSERNDACHCMTVNLN